MRRARPWRTVGCTALLVAASSCTAEPPARTASADSAVSSAVAAPADSTPEPIPRSACRPVGTPGVRVSDAELGLPREVAGIRGLITEVRAPFGQVEGFRIRVEQEPTRSAGTPKADVFVAPSTPVFQRVGHRASAAELRLCQELSIWFTGPVRESYPVQATARAIVIERTLERIPER